MAGRLLMGQKDLLSGKIMELVKRGQWTIRAAEKLGEAEGIAIRVSTPRRRFMAEGLWATKRQGKAYRSRRERRACLGKPLRFDGSPHGWLEGRRGICGL
ncbi:MAG: hypothetical protein LBQ30_08480 [Treponema sp.]|jgi:hypothetical protein|nr:hypothetical protein [Treponema sp.]